MFTDDLEASDNEKLTIDNQNNFGASTSYKSKQEADDQKQTKKSICGKSPKKRNLDKGKDQHICFSSNIICIPTEGLQFVEG